jgi:O-antigen/teichoic acid export membrane protein
MNREGPTVSPLADAPDNPEALATEVRRRVVRGGTLAVSGLLTSQAISFAGFIVLARLAPPSTFGAYAAASIITGAGLLFTEGGMQSAVVQRSGRVEEAASTAFAANIVGAFCLAVVAAALAPLVGLFFHSGEIARAAAVMAGTIPINAAAIVPGALLQRRLSFRFPLVGPLEACAYVASAIVGLSTGLGVWGLVIATYVASCARTTAVLALAGWRPSVKLVSWDVWLSLSRYGRPVVMSSLLREIGFAGSTAFVGRVLGTGDLGRFRAAQRAVLQLSTAVVFGSNYVLLPVFARVWKDEEQFRYAIIRALRTLTLIVFPVSLVFIPLGRPFATIFLGDRWTSAGSIMMAMAGVGIALSLDSVCSEAFKAAARTDLLPRMHGLTAVVPIGFMFALQDFGAPGMGLAMSLGMGVVAAYAIRGLGRVSRTPLSLLVVQLWPAASSGLLMAATVYFLDRNVIRAESAAGAVAVGLFALDVLAAGAAYFTFLLLLSRKSVVELKVLAQLLVGRTAGSHSTPVR